MINRKPTLVIPLLIASIFFGGCSAPTPTPVQTQTETPDVTLTGTVIQAGNRFSLSSTGKPPVELDSRKVKLVNYVGKTVSVTGQYSGTTLFVDKIE
jgi:PBP1b-binding outer membrane lipoprotein LpoB